jgi:hypothetical protein
MAGKSPQEGETHARVRRYALAGALALAFGAAACSSSNNNNTNKNANTNAGAASTTVSQTTVAASGASPSAGSPVAGAAGTARAGTAAAGGLATAAAVTGTSVALPTVNVTEKDFSFDAPDSVQAGLTRIHVVNQGKEDHQAQLLKLNPGVTLQQLQAAAGGDPAAVLPFVAVAGGGGTAPAGGSQDIVQNLQPGQYVLVCFISGDDNVPHIAKGMIKPLAVTGTAPAQVTLLATPNTVTATEFKFAAPASVNAGQVTLQFTNSGSQPHEMTIVKLNGNLTAQQFAALAANPNATPPAGPPPFSSVGGVGGLVPGGSGQTTLNLTAGNYVLVCYIPDPATGKSHAALGMVQGFSVK